MTEAADDDAYCSDSVRRHDVDRWLAALFVPEARRRHVMALYALDAEVARARDSVSEAILGEMRLTWWSEAVQSALSQAPPAHPVARALARAVAAYPHEREAFDALLAARGRELDPTPAAGIEEWTRHAEATAVALMRLAAEAACGERLASGAVTALRNAGLAIALAEAASHRPPGVRRLEQPPGQKPGEMALDHLALARQQSHAAPRAALPIFWPATLKVRHGARMGLPRKLLKLQWAAWRGRF